MHDRAAARPRVQAYDPGVAFKHWKPQNLFGSTDMSHAEVVSAFDLPINATALGYYVNDPTALAAEPAKFAAYEPSPSHIPSPGARRPVHVGCSTTLDP